MTFFMSYALIILGGRLIPGHLSISQIHHPNSYSPQDIYGFFLKVDIRKEDKWQLQQKILTEVHKTSIRSLWRDPPSLHRLLFSFLKGHKTVLQLSDYYL